MFGVGCFCLVLALMFWLLVGDLFGGSIFSAFGMASFDVCSLVCCKLHRLVACG